MTSLIRRLLRLLWNRPNVTWLECHPERDTHQVQTMPQDFVREGSLYLGPIAAFAVLSRNHLVPEAAMIFGTPSCSLTPPRVARHPSPGCRERGRSKLI